MRSNNFSTFLCVLRFTIPSHDNSSRYTRCPHRAGLIDPYKTYLLERWQQGCHKGVQLERELRIKGYKGSRSAVYRYLQTLEPSQASSCKRGSASTSRVVASSLKPNALLALSAQQATWLFFRKDTVGEVRISLSPFFGKSHKGGLSCLCWRNR
jgi:hypothetical protein